LDVATHTYGTYVKNREVGLEEPEGETVHGQPGVDLAGDKPRITLLRGTRPSGKGELPPSGQTGDFTLV